jgi:hypothetical protein
VRELPAAGRGRKHGGSVVDAELVGTGQEVGMQVSVGGVPDAKATPLGGGADRAQVTARVDDKSSTVAEVDEVGAIAQSRIHQRHYVRLSHDHATF